MADMTPRERRIAQIVLLIFAYTGCVACFWVASESASIAGGADRFVYTMIAFGTTFFLMAVLLTISFVGQLWPCRGQNAE